MPTTSSFDSDAVAEELILAMVGDRSVVIEDNLFAIISSNIHCIHYGSFFRFTPELIKAIATRRAPRDIRELLHYKLLRKALNQIDIALSNPPA